MTSELLRKLLTAGGIVARQAKARAEGFRDLSEGWGDLTPKRPDLPS